LQKNFIKETFARIKFFEEVFVNQIFWKKNCEINSLNFCKSSIRNHFKRNVSSFAFFFKNPKIPLVGMRSRQGSETLW